MKWEVSVRITEAKDRLVDVAIDMGIISKSVPKKYPDRTGMYSLSSVIR
jgi:hypothetical protein